jgi:MFS family permease
MHLVAYVSPLLGVGAAGAALSLTTLAAVVGRFPVGALADRMDRRIVACLNFLFEVAGLSLLLIATSAPLVYAGCVLFGLGVGNMISLPALLVQREFPPEQFAGLVSLIMATGQFTLALAPGVIGVLRDVTGGYEAALAMCVALELAGALVIVLGRASARDRLEALPNPVGGGEMST